MARAASVLPCAYQALDRPAEWHPLDVRREHPRLWDWVVLMVDVHPDELKHCLCKFAWLFVHPDDYRPEPGRTAREAWVRIPGKHRNSQAAWDAVQEMVATRH